MFGIINNKQWSFVEPRLKKLSYTLIGIEVFGRYPRSTMRIYIDSKKGISLADCEKATKALLEIDEDHELFDRLEVSSPGINRKIFTIPDLKQQINKTITIKTIKPIHNAKKHTGKLTKATDTLLEINAKNETNSIDYFDIASITIVQKI